MQSHICPSVVPTKTLHASLDCFIHATCPVRLNRLDLRFVIMLRPISFLNIISFHIRLVRMNGCMDGVYRLSCSEEALALR